MAKLLDEPAVVRRDLGVVRVTGPDRLSYLHTLLSQHLEQARPGTVADFLYLDAKGNALASGRAVVRAEDVLLATPAAVAADLTAALEKFKFLTDVESADLSGNWAVASVRGPGTVDVPGARSEVMTATPQPGGVVVRDRSGGVDVVGEREWVDGVVRGLGLPEATAQEWEAWRISAGEPAWGAEISSGVRAQELGLLPTHVHLRKGCYPGQESIAKIYNLGRPRRSLAVVEASAEVAPGDPVTAGAKTGKVTSAAPVGPSWVALALVPVGADGTLPEEVTLGGAAGRVRRRVGEGLAIPGA